MSKRLKYISITIALLVAILLIAPLFISLESYKGIIISEVKKATGRDLTIDDKISLSLFPYPKVILNKVKLSSLPQAQFPYTLEAEKVLATLAISNLLTGKIVFSYVELEHPEIYLEVMDDGTQTWEFNKKTQGNNSEGHSSATSKEAKTKAAPFPIKRLIINKGKVQYTKGQEKTLFEDINIDISLGGLKGPVDFKTNFQAQGQAITLIGTAKEIGDIIPLTAKLEAFGEKMTIKGELDTKKVSFSGVLELQGNLMNALQNYKKVELPKLLKSDFKIVTQLYADKDSTIIDHIDLNIGTLKAHGKGSYNITNAAGNITLNLSSIQADIALETKKEKSGRYETKIKLHAHKILPLLELLEVDAKKLPEFTDQEFFFETAADYNENETIFKEILFSSDQAQLSGMLGIKNIEKKMVYSYDFRSDNGSAIASFLNYKLPINLSNIRMKGIISKVGDIIDINTNIFAAQSITAIEGEINLAKEIKAPFVITTTGNNLAQTLRQLFGNSVSQGLGKFSLSSKVQGNLSKNLNIHISNSTIAIGNENTAINGDSTLTLGHDKPNINLNLETSFISLDSLTGQPTKRTTSTTSSSNSANPAGTSTQTSQWSQDKLDLTALQAFEGDINLSIAKLTKGALVFDEMNAKMKITKGTLHLNSLTGRLYGGNVSGSGSISSQVGQPLSFKGYIKDAQLKNIIPNRGEIKVTQGLFNSTVDLKSQGNSQYQYMQNLNGDVEFNGSNGKLSGVDLQKAVNSIMQVRNLEGILKILDASFSGGETNFKGLEGAFAINKGNARLTAFKLDAQGAVATATGYVNLLDYVMDIAATINIDTKGFPPFTARIYGPLDNPMHKLDTKSLQQYLMKNVLTNIIDTLKDGKNKPDDIIKGIMGFGKKGNGASPPAQNSDTATPSTDSDSATPSQKPVDDMIQKGLRKLFKN